MPKQPTATGKRLRALRIRLGISQATLAKLMDVARISVLRMESGANQLTSDATRARLAAALGLPSDHLSAYLNGSEDLESIAAKSLNPAIIFRTKVPGWLQQNKKPFHVAIPQDDDSTSPIETAIAFAFDPNRHSLSDIDVARKFARLFRWNNVSEISLRYRATDMLDAAAARRNAPSRHTVGEYIIDLLAVSSSRFMPLSERASILMEQERSPERTLEMAALREQMATVQAFIYEINSLLNLPVKNIGTAKTFDDVVDSILLAGFVESKAFSDPAASLLAPEEQEEHTEATKR